MECAVTSLPNSSSLLFLPPHAFPLLQHGSSQGLFPQATVWAGFFEETLGALVWHTQAGKYLLLYLLHRGLLQRLQWNLQHIHFFLFLQPLCSLCYVTLSLCFPSNCVFWVFLFPCLNMFSQRHHCAGWGAQLHPAVNPWSWLDPCPAWAWPFLTEAAPKATSPPTPI